MELKVIVASEIDGEPHSGNVITVDLQPYGLASAKEVAEEIAERILNGEDDERIKRLVDGSVKVLVSKMFPTGSGFHRTVSGRRKRLVQYVAERLFQEGWVESIGKVFKSPPEEFKQVR